MEKDPHITGPIEGEGVGGPSLSEVLEEMKAHMDSFFATLPCVTYQEGGECPYKKS